MSTDDIRCCGQMGAWECVYMCVIQHNIKATSCMLTGEYLGEGEEELSPV